jgi:hypothetical protein
MIHLAFSHWWLLLPLAIVLIFITSRYDDGDTGIGAGLQFLFVGFVCLAVFLIVLACMVGYSLGHHG